MTRNATIDNGKDPQSTVSTRHVRALLSTLRQYFPERSEDRNVDFLDALIAILLSQNTNDRNSHRAYLALRKRYADWDAVGRARHNTIARTIRVAGLADQKAAAIKNLLGEVRKRWGSTVGAPFASMTDDALLEFLTSIGGIGVKTAACAMMFALDRDLCAVDTHIHRVLNRMGVVHTTSANKTYDLLQPLIPEGSARELHVLLIQHGRSICKARNPHCFECPVYDLCAWTEKERHAAEKKPGPKPVSGDFLITDGI